MNAVRRHQAECVNSTYLNGTELQPPWFSELASCKFWSIIHNEFSAHVTALLVFSFFVISLIINTCLLVSLGQSEAVSWKCRFFLLKNVLVGDLLQSLSLAPSALYCFVKQQTLKFSALCVVQYCTTSVAIIISLLTVTSMCLERFLYTCHGTHYLTIMTNARMRIYVTSIWLLALTGAGTSTVLVLTGRAEFGHVISGLVCEPEVVQAELEQPLYFEKFNKAFVGSLLILCLLVFAFSYGRMTQVGKLEQEPFRQDSICARSSVALYLGVFFLQLFPRTVKFIAMFGTDVSSHLMFVLSMLVPPCINPLAYSMRNAEVRQALKHLWGWRSLKKYFSAKFKM